LSPWTIVIALLPVVFLGWLFLRPYFTPSLTLPEKRGKQIYFEGTSPGDGKITAYIGKEQIKLPGSAATCASCHGPDGRGRPEAGVIPSDLTWDHLMKSYGHSHPKGRKHPAFTEASLKRSILNGDDPAGNRLDASMPTYTMSVEDINDLVAYMKRMETDFDPGLADKSIRIGTMLPSSGQIATIGQGMVEVMAVYFEDINSRGGIYNRKLELVASPYDSNNSGQSAISSARRLIEEKNVFAIVGAVIAGADREVTKLAEEKKIPLIGPLTFFSTDQFDFHEYTFYLLSGLNEQVRALVDFAFQELNLDHPRIAVIGLGDDQQQELQASVKEQSREHGWTSVAGFSFLPNRFDAAAAATALRDQRIEALFYLGYSGLDAQDKLATVYFHARRVCKKRDAHAAGQLSGQNLPFLPDPAVRPDPGRDRRAATAARETKTHHKPFDISNFGPDSCENTGGRAEIGRQGSQPREVHTLPGKALRIFDRPDTPHNLRPEPPHRGAGGAHCYDRS